MTQTTKVISFDEIEVCVAKITRELHAAERKHPAWPDDVVHGAAIMAEEAGESVQAALEHYYRRNNETLRQLRTELAQTGAMCVRMLAHLPREE